MKGGEVLSSTQSYFFEVLNVGECRLGHCLGLEHCPDPSVASVLAKKTGSQHVSDILGGTT